MYVEATCAAGVAFGSSTFTDVRIQTVAEYTTYPLYLDDCDFFQFINLHIWDWAGTAVQLKQIYISPRCIRTDIDALGFDYYDKSIYDLGNTTSVHSSNMGHLYDRGPYTYIIFRNSTTIFLVNGSTGLIVSKSTNARTIFYNAQNYATNANIFIREGTYDFDDSVGSSTITGITWEGASNRKTILRVKTATDITAIFNVNGKENCTFRNICFDGNLRDAMGIYIGQTDSTKNILIENCVFQHFNRVASTLDGAIYINGGSSDTYTNIKIINCEFNDNDCGIRFTADSDSKITLCDITGNYFYGAHATNIWMVYANNCTIDRNRIVGGTNGMIIDSCNNLTITNNIIETATNGIDEQNTTNYNIYLGNNCRTCTTDYDINCVAYFPYPAVNFSNFNIGTWT
jgi:parallel beta-helix repeat protein